MANKLWYTRAVAAVATGALAVTLAACGGEGAGSGGGDEDAAPEEGGLVGVAMPTETSERWIADGASVEEGLQDAGYDVDLQFAGDDIPTQQEQIDAMINDGARALIIAAIDGTTLTGQLEAAAAQDIPVISYDRLIRDSGDVDFYVSFDNFEVGVAQANTLLNGLGLVDEAGEPVEDAPEGPFNVELFAGSLDDNNAHFFWDGAMSVLEPLIDDGTLVVPSEQTDIDQAATQRWSQEAAQSRMEDLLTANYDGDEKVDGVLSPYDGISRGIIEALRSGGYKDDAMPPVTGQDAEIASVKYIADGVQHATIFKDTRLLADQAVTAAETILAGDEPEANNTEDYDNGVKVVPSYLLPVVPIYADNIESELVDSGYWTAEEIEAGVAEGE
ncbi:sugar ABC transporter substrate-binding protein [Myceligenerans cantabricum]